MSAMPSAPFARQISIVSTETLPMQETRTTSLVSAGNGDREQAKTTVFPLKSGRCTIDPSLSNRAASFCLIAPVGQAPAHIPQPTHAESSIWETDKPVLYRVTRGIE